MQQNIDAFAVMGDGRTVHFTSRVKHCWGCQLDKEAGCTDIKGCYCAHQKEFERDFGSLSAEKGQTAR